MDWIKLLLCLNGLLLCSFRVKAEKERKASFDLKLTNSTRHVPPESQSEIAAFHNLSLLRENKESVSAINIYKSSRSKNNNEAKNADDLTGEANIHSPAFTFTEAPLGEHWHIVPEIIPYTPRYNFINPLPIVESQSFLNAPVLTNIQKNYKPIGIQEARNVHSNSEYSGDHSGHYYHRHPESENHPSHERAVHTETIHDFGRFLPEEYKSKIEKEAELLIKRKKTDNATIATATTNRPQTYTAATQSHVRENRQSARRYPHRYQKPVNSAFFHKGNFESAYPFPDDNQDDRRQISTSEGYPEKLTRVEVNKPVTPIKIGEPYIHKGGITSTEMYHRDYSYPSEQDYSHGAPYTTDPYQENAYVEEPPPKDGHRNPQYNRNVNQQYEDPDYRNKKLVNVHHENVHEKNIEHSNEPHMNSDDQAHHYSSTFKQNLKHEYIRPNDPYKKDFPPVGPPNAPEQYGSPTKAYAPTYPDTYQKPASNHPDTAAYRRQPYSHPEHQNHPQHYDNVEYKHPWSHSTEFYQPLTDSPQNDNYSNLPPKTFLSSSDPSKYNTNSEYHSVMPHKVLDKNPLKNEAEKPYYNSFKSLADLYKSFGFQPLRLDEISILPPRFPYERPFQGKIGVSGSKSGYGLSNDFIRPSKPPTYLTNLNSPRDQNFDNYHDHHSNSGPTTINYTGPYSSIKHNSKENVPSNNNYGEPNTNLRYNSRENERHNINHGIPHSNLNYNSGGSGPSSINYGAKHSHMRYNSEENGPSSASYGGQHYDMKYHSKENYPNSYFKHSSSEGSVNSPYPAYASYNTNPSPAVSTEHYDPPETPHSHHTQIETPKEAFEENGFKTHSYSPPITFSPPNDENVNGIRIKDYDAETYFGDPPQSEINPVSYPTNTSLYSHSIVRNNPYNIKSSYSGEVEESYRPRRYRQKLKIEIDPSVEVSDEKSNSFHSNEKKKEFRSHKTKNNNGGFLSVLQPFNTHNEDNEPILTKSKNPTRSTNKNQQRGHNSKRKSKSHQRDVDDDFNYDQEHRYNNKKKKSPKRPYEDEFTRSQPEEDYPSPRHRKRSSHRSSRKNRSSNKSQPENMRAEGSTSHWGMERHKGTDGFFQYVNVPGAKAFEYGYRMGGPEQTRERHHRTVGEQSKIKVNWKDGNGDSGDHYWEFNHNAKEDDGENEEETKIKSKLKTDISSEESSE